MADKKPRVPFAGLKLEAKSDKGEKQPLAKVAVNCQLAELADKIVGTLTVLKNKRVDTQRVKGTLNFY